MGEANCIQSLGDIALAQGDAAEAASQFREALQHYRVREEPYSIGMTLGRLARLEARKEQRQALLREAVDCWTRIDLPDLVAEIRAEFPGEC